MDPIPLLLRFLLVTFILSSLSASTYEDEFPCPPPSCLPNRKKPREPLPFGLPHSFASARPFPFRRLSLRFCHCPTLSVARHNSIVVAGPERTTLPHSTSTYLDRIEDWERGDHLCDSEGESIGVDIILHLHSTYHIARARSLSQIVVSSHSIEPQTTRPSPPPARP